MQNTQYFNYITFLTPFQLEFFIIYLIGKYIFFFNLEIIVTLIFKESLILSTKTFLYFYFHQSGQI